MDQSKQPQEQFTFYRQRPDGDIDPTGEAGWYLQREREQRGLTLEQAGEAIAIHPHHLQGIEDGDLTKLPPRTEALRMIGTYAQFLNFDPQPLILHYTQFLPQPMPIAKSAKPRRPHPLSSAKIIKFANLDKLKSYTPGAGGIVASVLAAVVVFQGVVFALSPSSPESAVIQPQLTAQIDTGQSLGTTQVVADEQVVSSINTIEEISLDDAQDDQIGGLTQLADQSTGGLTQETNLSGNVSTEEADQSAGGLTGLTELIERDVATLKVPLPRVKPISLSDLPGVKAEAPAPANIEPVAVTTTQTSSTMKAHGSDNANSRLVLKAKAAVWIRIEDQQGNVVMTQTLNKGDSYRVPAREGLIVIARDGGAINYAIDGVEKGPLGNLGEILVGRSLDLSALATPS